MSEPSVSAEEAAPNRLFGLVGAEQLHSDPFYVWEMNVSEAGEPLVVEEWTVRPPGEHLPSAADVLESIAYQCEDGETDEGWFESLGDALTAPDVVTLAEQLLDAVAQRITYRMAGDLIATHIVSEIDGKLTITNGNAP